MKRNIKKLYNWLTTIFQTNTFIFLLFVIYCVSNDIYKLAVFCVATIIFYCLWLQIQINIIVKSTNEYIDRMEKNAVSKSETTITKVLNIGHPNDKV